MPTNSPYQDLTSLIQGVSWTPIIKGASDDPASVSYANRVATYYMVGNMCLFNFSFQTTTMTKSTLTDQVRISLPFTSKNTSGNVVACSLRISNATPVVNANYGLIQPNVAYIEASQVPLVAAVANFTYALVTGIGVLTNTITYQGSGWYEVAV